MAYTYVTDVGQTRLEHPLGTVLPPRNDRTRPLSIYGDVLPLGSEFLVIVPSAVLFLSTGSA